MVDDNIFKFSVVDKMLDKYQNQNKEKTNSIKLMMIILGQKICL